MASAQGVKDAVTAEGTLDFATQTDDAIRDILNDVIDQDSWASVTAAQIYQALDSAEMALVTDVAENARLDRILRLSGDIETGPGNTARDELIGIFGGGSATIGNLAAIARTQISLATKHGLGQVHLEDVTQARAL